MIGDFAPPPLSPFLPCLPFLRSCLLLILLGWVPWTCVRSGGDACGALQCDCDRRSAAGKPPSPHCLSGHHGGVSGAPRASHCPCYSRLVARRRRRLRSVMRNKVVWWQGGGGGSLASNSILSPFPPAFSTSDFWDLVGSDARANVEDWFNCCGFENTTDRSDLGTKRKNGRLCRVPVMTGGLLYLSLFI